MKKRNVIDFEIIEEGAPIISELSNVEIDGFISSLEFQIVDYFQNLDKKTSK